MTTQEMLDTLKRRTKVADQTKLIAELQSAYRWAARRIFNAEGGPDMLVTIGEELTALASTTRTYDLAAAVSGGLLGIKKLWIKFPADVNFSVMTPTDANDPEFIALDSSPNASPLIATSSSVMYQVINVGSLRFAPALPAGAIIRADYFRTGEPPDPSNNPTAENGSDLPEVFHDGICSKAIAQIFGLLDDDREGAWETRARDEMNDAIYQATKRTQGPTATAPYRFRRRRVI